MTRHGPPKMSICFMIALGTLFALSAIAAILLGSYHMREQALSEARAKALILLNRNVATHTYFSDVLKPKLLEWGASLMPPDYFEPCWMSSSFAVSEINKNFKALNNSETYYKEGTVNARSPSNEADPIERAFLEEANRNPNLVEQSGIRTLDGKPWFTVLHRSVIIEARCLRCHGNPEDAPRGLVERYGSQRGFGRKPGAVAAVISVRIPLSAAYANANRLALEFSALIALVLLALFSGLWWFYRKSIQTPLDSIRHKALDIAHRGESLGEQIPLPAFKEFHDLATAFNLLSTNLRRNVDQLEARVKERTEALTTANDQLRHAQKMEALGTLAGGIAHDFNNILAAILGYAELSLYDIETSSPARNSLDQIIKASYRAKELVSQILTFSSKESSVEHSPVDLTLLVVETLKFIRASLPSTIEIRHDIPDYPLLALVNRDQIHQVLINLCTNAAQAMEDNGGTLSIELSEFNPHTPSEPLSPDLSPRTYIRLTVSDTGHGMDEAVLRRIFDPYFTTREIGKGSGLGLSIVHGTVKRHGGAIRVSSELEKGSVFHIFLPRAEAEWK